VGTDTATDAINGFFNGLGHAIADAMWPIAYMLIGSILAAPAIGSVLLVLLSSRWGLLRESAITSVVAGAILTFFGYYFSLLCIAMIDNSGMFAREWVLVLPWIGGALLLAAVYLQYLWRAGLNRARIAGIASCVLLVVGALAMNEMMR
jgi:peptidoglycan/LPS O-acetylase OafA/YrhL